MACEYCGIPKLCSDGVCINETEALHCGNYRPQVIQSMLPLVDQQAIARARAQLIDAEDRRRRWTEENLPMDRRMLTRAPERPELTRHMPAYRAYFAHPMPDYDTALERDAVAAIQRELGAEFHVVNPNSQEHRDGYALTGHLFSYWTRLACDCGTLVYMSLPEGWIGSGVWKEAEAALLAGRRVYEIDRGDLGFARVAHLDVSRCLSVDETRRVTHMIRHYREVYGG